MIARFLINWKRYQIFSSYCTQRSSDSVRLKCKYFEYTVLQRAKFDTLIVLKTFFRSLEKDRGCGVVSRSDT